VVSDHSDKLEDITTTARKRAFDYFTWDKKASQIHDVYRWVTGKNIKKPLVLDALKNG